MNIRQKEFSKWLKTNQGKQLTALEKVHLESLLKKIYGSQALILGDPAQADLANTLQVNSAMLIHPSKPRKTNVSSFVCAQYGKLPVASDSMHIALMPHTLEFVVNPHHVLREIERVLRPEGHVVIVGFNPLSLYGIRRFFSNEGACAGQFRTLGKVKDWLKLLGFDVLNSNYYKFSRLAEKKSSLIHNISQWACPIFAGIYIIIAKKSILGVTPQKPEWVRSAKFIKKGLVKPASRDICRD